MIYVSLNETKMKRMINLGANAERTTRENKAWDLARGPRDEIRNWRKEASDANF